MPTAFSYNAFLFSRERLFQAVTPAPDLSLFSVRLPPEFYRETQSENILFPVVKSDYRLSDPSSVYRKNMFFQKSALLLPRNNLFYIKPICCMPISLYSANFNSYNQHFL